MARILISPLNWGLGHSTRIIPIIRILLEKGHEVGIAAKGPAVKLLKKEFPDIEFYKITDYPLPYTKNGFSYNRLIRLLPEIVFTAVKENEEVEKLVKKFRFDLIISDNRFGFYSKNVPSVFMSHQLKYHMPGNIKLFENTGKFFNTFYHKNFEKIIVPDNPPNSVSLSGKLGNIPKKNTKNKIYYAGILSSIRKQNVKKDIDYLISISGPERSKTAFKEKIMSQIKDLAGKKVVLLGEPCSNSKYRAGKNTLVKSHATREEMTSLMNRARFIITRSGYTTIMELAELGKKNALFIPTPHQTEQEYLSKYYEEKKWFHSVKQSKIDLLNDVEECKYYKGLPKMPKTSDNAKRLYNKIFKKYLD
jgi:uncharacterized protein (TIGR00661 family)